MEDYSQLTLRKLRENGFEDSVFLIKFPQGYLCYKGGNSLAFTDDSGESIGFPSTMEALNLAFTAIALQLIPDIDNIGAFEIEEHIVPFRFSRN